MHVSSRDSVNQSVSRQLRRFGLRDAIPCCAKRPTTGAGEDEQSKRQRCTRLEPIPETASRVESLHARAAFDENDNSQDTLVGDTCDGSESSADTVVCPTRAAQAVAMQAGSWAMFAEDFLCDS